MNAFQKPLARTSVRAPSSMFAERAEVERGVFTPLVFSTTGGMGREASTFYKRLADMIAQKRQQPYPAVMGWLRCRLSFASLRAEAETACQKWGGSAFIKWGLFTFILNRPLVFNMFFVTTSNFGGLSPPLSKSGGLKPPLPPQVLCLCRASIMCIRGSRSSFHRPIYGSDITLATSEGRIPSI